MGVQLVDIDGFQAGVLEMLPDQAVNGVPDGLLELQRFLDDQLKQFGRDLEQAYVVEVEAQLDGGQQVLRPPGVSIVRHKPARGALDQLQQLRLPAKVLHQLLLVESALYIGDRLWYLVYFMCHMCQ